MWSVKVSRIRNEPMMSSFLPKYKPKITRISALQTRIIALFLVSVGSFFLATTYPCLLGRAEILVILGKTMTSQIHSEFN